MKHFFYFIVFMPFLSKGQERTSENAIACKGISFVQGLNWGQVKQKAKEENKYIFVDCYATWCGPCKAMDKDVFSSKKVGEMVNERFIAIKIQMDTTSNDDEFIKNGYGDASVIKNMFNIVTLPTYLFFSPEGSLVDKSLGYINEDEFIRLINSAANPSKQYYRLLECYRQGYRDYKVMPYLARKARNNNMDKDWAHVIAGDYKKNYLDRASDSILLLIENIEFIIDFSELVNSTKDVYFHLFYDNGDKVDKIIKIPGYSNRFASSLIAKDEIIEKIWTAEVAKFKEPDWEQITFAIEHKYKRINADSLVLESKLSYYLREKDFKKYISNIELKMKLYPPKSGGKSFGTWGDALELNRIAWNIFKYSNRKSDLKKALKWSELSIKILEPKLNPQYLDTKANLLYKLGKVRKAISLEERALKVVMERSKANGQPVMGGLIDIFSKTVEKMKKREPTWPIK